MDSVTGVMGGGWNWRSNQLSENEEIKEKPAMRSLS